MAYAVLVKRRRSASNFLNVMRGKVWVQDKEIHFKDRDFVTVFYYVFFAQDFLHVMREKVWELDNEIHFKDTFRVFSKDEEGKSV